MHSFDAPYLSAYYDRNLNAIVAEWHGYVEPDQALEGHQKLLELFRYYEANFLLSDLREHEGGFGAIQDWLHNHFLPDMIKLGYWACANVMPEEFLMEVSLHEFEDRQGGVVPVRFFADVDSARAWLANMRPVREHNEAFV